MHAQEYIFGSSCTTFTAASSTFSDGSGASNYLSNSDCFWIIAPAQATQVTIDSTLLGTEANYNFVDVYSCATMACETDATTWLAKLSGTQTGNYTSTKHYILVTFTSDSSLTYEGFSASWTTQHSVCTLSSYLSMIPNPILLLH